MLSCIDDLDYDLEYQTNIGKNAIFFNYGFPENYVFIFSSILEEIGSLKDVFVQQNTKVIILSDPINIPNSPYGDITVIKILAPNPVYVLTKQIKII